MKKFYILLFMLILTMAGSLSAENYVNWKGGFWLTLPDDWAKVDYRIVDRFLSYTDTSRAVFDYEAVFAPESLLIFAADAYLVITFDSTGELPKREADSILEAIAQSYGTDVFNAPIVELMTNLDPGKPKINYRERSVSVLSEMAYQPEAMKKLWLYMRLNDRGLISLYFYSPDSTFAGNKPIFDKILTSLSFENLNEAAGDESLTFTDIGGDSLGDPDVTGRTESFDDPQATKGIGSIKNILIVAVLIIIVFGLIWNFIIVPRTKKKTNQSK